jgi:hypothetical protein
MEKVIELSIEVILFLVASYFIFYRSWLKSLGREVAKLSTAKELTEIKESVKKDFNESLEIYKSKLNEELSLRIEPLKAELGKQNISHQIQFSFLHQERGKVLVELYKKLLELYSAMADWTATIHPVIENADKEREERAVRANKALFDFKDFFFINKIFFSKSFCTSIEELINVYWDKGWDFGFAQNRILEGNLPHDYFKDYTTQLTAISKELKEKIPLMISEIEDLCRTILNVQDEK